MESQYFLNLIYFFGLLITFVSSQCPFGSSSNSGTCVCLPGYTSTGSGSGLVCTSLCPVGNNCVVISKRTTSGEEWIHLREVELYMGITKLAISSLAFSMSSSYGAGSWSASICNDGVTTSTTSPFLCHTDIGDRNAWLLINAGSQSFSKVVVYNRIDYGQPYINVATLTMFNGATIINPAVTFSSLGSSLSTYTFYSIGFLCPTGNNCVVISKITTSGDEHIGLREVELYMGTTKLSTSSLAITMSSTYGSWPASKCNDGATTDLCTTDIGDRNAWLLINAGSQSFSKVVVYNQLDACCTTRINVATLTMFNGATIINPAVTFSSLGSGQATYTFYSIGFLCPVGNNCVVISKITTSDQEYINLQEVELFMGTTKLATSSLVFSMSSLHIDASGISWPASICNDGVTSSTTSPFLCHTATGDRNAWLLINAGSQSFSRVIVYNANDGTHSRINVATLTMFNGSIVTKPAVTFSSLGSGLATYTFCYTGFTGSTCVSPCLANNYYSFLNNSCTACPLGSSSDAGALSCTCLPGYASSGSASSLVCTACSEGSFSNAGDLFCASLPGYYNSHIANLTNGRNVAEFQIANLTNQISSLNDRMNTEIIGIKSNITDEISKIKLSLQKLTATLNKLRKSKRNGSKKITEL